MTTSILESLPPTALVIDLDGVVVDSSARIERTVDREALRAGDLQRYFASYDLYSQTTDGDTPIAAGMELARQLTLAYQPDNLIWLTARGENGRKPTRDWLWAHLPRELDTQYQQLLMRPELPRDAEGRFTDMFPLDVVEYKRQQLTRIRQAYRVLLSVDDHAAICEMFAQEGIPCLQAHFPGVNVYSGVEAKTLEVREIHLAASGDHASLQEAAR